MLERGECGRQRGVGSSMLAGERGGDHSGGRGSAPAAMRSVARGVMGAGVTATLIVALGGCSHMSGVHWPWSHRPTPPPPQVHELLETSDAGAGVDYPQYWRRNTLVVDLRNASGSGSFLLKQREGNPWPVRLAFRVTPGAIGVLEVKADERTVLPVTTEGKRPIVLELTPGIYTPKTAQIGVSWGPVTAPAP